MVLLLPADLDRVNALRFPDLPEVDRSLLHGMDTLRGFHPGTVRVPIPKPDEIEAFARARRQILAARLTGVARH